MDTDELLAELYAACRDGRRPSEAAARWFVGGVVETVRQGCALDAALGLSAVGRRSLRARLQAVRRDQELRRAMECMAFDEGAGPWEQAKRLAPEVRAFSRRTWRTVRCLPAAPVDWPQWRRHLFEAMRYGPVPESAPGLYAVATQADGAFSQSDGPITVLANLIDDPSENDNP